LKTKTKKNEKTKKNLLTMLIVLLALGFIGVGATALSVADDRTTHADNQAQAATPWNMSSWALTAAEARQNNRNNKRRKKEANKALWKATKDASKDIGDWNHAMVKSHRNGRPGTAQQKAAWKTFGLTTPYARACQVVEQIHFKVIEQDGANSIVETLTEEFEMILKRDTQRLADPTHKVDYLLHVCSSLGPAMNTVAKKTATEEMSKKSILAKLTTSPDELKAALENNKHLTDINGYELVIRPYKVGTKNGVTPVLNAEYYQAGNTPLRKAVKAQVEAVFDEKLWTPLMKKHEPSIEDSNKLIKSWVKKMNDDMTSVMRSPEWDEADAESRSIIIEAYNLANTIKATKSKDMAKEHKANLKELFNRFHEVNAKLQAATMPTREVTLKKEVDKQLKKEIKAVRSKEHSFEILMTRKEGKQTVATLLWHLSYMSHFKNKGNTFALNDHKGARFLLGPSNGVYVPDAIANGYINATANTSAGYDGRLSGDAVSMQMIRKSNNPHFFGVKKDMKNSEVSKVMNRRRSNRHMYTMMNVALGADPKQAPHLVLGLYTNPKLIESEGKMPAEVLIKDIESTSIKPQVRPAPRAWTGTGSSKNRKSNKKTPGPNTKKNRSAVEKANAKKAEEEAKQSATPEEIAEYKDNQQKEEIAKKITDLGGTPPNKGSVDDFQATLEKVKVNLAYDKMQSMTVAELKEELKAAGLPVSGKKATLKQRLVAHGWHN